MNKIEITNSLDKVQAAILSAMEYLENDLDIICDENTYEQCKTTIDELYQANQSLENVIKEL